MLNIVLSLKNKQFSSTYPSTYHTMTNPFRPLFGPQASSSTKELKCFTSQLLGMINHIQWAFLHLPFSYEVGEGPVSNINVAHKRKLVIIFGRPLQPTHMEIIQTSRVHAILCCDMVRGQTKNDQQFTFFRHWTIHGLSGFGHKLISCLPVVSWRSHFPGTLQYNAYGQF